MNGPKILFFDIETKPILCFTWGIWDQNVGLNQIEDDWSVMSWAAKWQGSKEVLYMDNRKAKDLSKDKRVLKGIWKLLDQADIVVTQNGKAFDQKKLNARFIMNDMKPPSSYKHIDTKQLAKRHFAFTSNKLEYMTDKLCTKYKKLSHGKFPGMKLWLECMLGNPEAWKEMEKYNKYDVLSLEELYDKLIPWDNSVNFNLYHDGTETVCTCGSTDFQRNGHSYTSVGKFQRLKCRSCGSEVRSRNNLLSKEKKASLKAKP